MHLASTYCGVCRIPENNPKQIGLYNCVHHYAAAPAVHCGLPAPATAWSQKQVFPIYYDHVDSINLWSHLNRPQFHSLPPKRHAMQETNPKKKKEENAVPEPPENPHSRFPQQTPRNQTPFTTLSATADLPPAVQSSSNVDNFAKLTGFITYASTPAVYACFWSLTLARPVKAMIRECSGG